MLADRDEARLQTLCDILRWVDGLDFVEYNFLRYLSWQTASPQSGKSLRFLQRNFQAIVALLPEVDLIASVCIADCFRYKAGIVR